MRTPKEVVNDLLASGVAASVTEEEIRELDSVLGGVMRPSNASVHKAVRNFLINDLKISHDSVSKMIRDLAAEQMTAWLNSQVSYVGGMIRVSEWLTKVVTTAVTVAIKDHVATRLRGARIAVVVE